METQKCFICGKKSKPVISKIPYHADPSKFYSYEYFGCCGYFKQKKFLSDSKIKELYKENYDDFNINPVLMAIKDIATGNKIKKMEEYIRGKRVLEVGSSVGSFLAECEKKEPLSLTGLEISEEATKIARKKLPDANIEVTSFEDYETREKFDSIFMFHVIEHFKDPLLAAKKVYKLLAKNGVTVMETPSYDSWEQKAFKDNWYGWQVPFHTFVFSRRSLSRLLKKAGFIIKKINESTVPNSWVGSLKKKWPKIKKMGFLSMIFYGLFFLPSYFAAKNHKAGRIIIHAYKK